MRDRTLSKIVWVADRGFTSAENRRYLRKGDHHYIIGERLRSGSAEAAHRDAAIRERMLAKLAEMIVGSGKLTATKRAELRGVISTKPGLNRYLRVTPGGLLRTTCSPSSRSRTPKKIIEATPANP
jgi:hypothetical protein